MLPYTGEVRNIAKAVKTGDRYACELIARHLSHFVCKGDIIVPAPNHNGYADYTLHIAQAVQKYSGAEVIDALKVRPHIPLYYSDKREDIDITMALEKTIPNNRNVFFLDNVIATGMTYSAAKVEVPQLRPLFYATSGRVRF